MFSWYSSSDLPNSISSGFGEMVQVEVTWSQYKYLAKPGSPKDLQGIDRVFFLKVVFHHVWHKKTHVENHMVKTMLKPYLIVKVVG